MLTFEPGPHIYRWKGDIVPGVTTILERGSKFGFVSPAELEAAQDRGTFVHKCTELDDQGVLHDDEVTGPYGGYIQAWRSFCSDYGADWTGREEQGYSQRFGYAGTMDCAGTLARFGKTLWVIDIKTSEQKYRVWRMQTAAYRQLKAEQDPRWALARRGSVRLRADGKYRFDIYDSPLDLPAFLALITYLNWEQT